MMRALALAVRVRKAELEAVLPRPGAAAEDFRDRKQIEDALLRLCRAARAAAMASARAQRRRYECKEQRILFSPPPVCAAYDA